MIHTEQGELPITSDNVLTAKAETLTKAQLIKPDADKLRALLLSCYSILTKVS